MNIEWPPHPRENFLGPLQAPPAYTEHRPTFSMQEQAKNSTFHFKVLGFWGAFPVLLEGFKKA